MKAMVRTHVLLPRDLVEAVDELVGERRRSRFVEEAVEEKMARERQRKAVVEAAGILKGANYPYWSTPKQTSQWVRDLRREADAATMRKVSRSDDTTSA